MNEILPVNFFEVLDRAGICTPRQVILLSLWDIKKLTKLKDDDIRLIKSLVAENVCPQPITANRMHTKPNKLKTGCTNIDTLLNGGFRRGTISEIYGESGTGKTQLAIQTAAHCSPSGSVYICTEDVFPVKRYNQINEFVNGDMSTEYGKNMYIEHVTESLDLIVCIKIRLSKLLSKNNNISLIVLDSVAAPFRCEHTCYVQRAEELKELGMLLVKIAQQYNLGVICINQVTASFNNSDTILPSLGLTWSNMITYRFMLKKTNDSYNILNLNHGINIRHFGIVNAPDLPNNIVEFVITSNGIENISNKL